MKILVLCVDDRQARQAIGQMHLDADAQRFYASQRAASQYGKAHGLSGSGE